MRSHKLKCVYLAPHFHSCCLGLGELMIDMPTTKWVPQKQPSFCSEMECTNLEDNSSCNGAASGRTWPMHYRLYFLTHSCILKYEQLQLIQITPLILPGMSGKVLSNSCFVKLRTGLVVLTGMFQNKCILTFESWAREGLGLLAGRQSVCMSTRTRRCLWAAIPCRTVVSAENGFSVCPNWARLATPALIWALSDTRISVQPSKNPI